MRGQSLSPPGSAIGILAVADPKHQDGNFLVLNVANQPIVRHAISPQAALIADSRSSASTRQ